VRSCKRVQREAGGFATDSNPLGETSDLLHPIQAQKCPQRIIASIVSTNRLKKCPLCSLCPLFPQGLHTNCTRKWERRLKFKTKKYKIYTKYFESLGNRTLNLAEGSFTLVGRHLSTSKKVVYNQEDYSATPIEVGFGRYYLCS